MRYVIFAFMLTMLISGCAHKHDEIKEEHEPIKKTVWTEKLEIFIEYDKPLVGGDTGFLLHLTNLKDFSPVSEGILSLKFAPELGEPITLSIPTPESPGIYRASVVFEQKGHYALTASFEDKAFSDRFVIKDIDVIDENEKHIYEQKKDTEKGIFDIALLKEQQWAVDFMVALPEKRNIPSSFIALGELVPASNTEVTLSSPVSGIISLSKMLPYAGKRVTKGEVIAIVEPPVIQQGGIGQLIASYAEAKNRVILAEREYERAKRLYEAKAVPQRRLEEAELAIKSAKANLEPLKMALENMKMSPSDGKLTIKSPLSGTVSDLFISNGKAVEAGQPIVKIINISTLWLQANVPASKIGKLQNLNKATFNIEGLKDTFSPSRLVVINPIIDPYTRTVPVIFEVNNRRGLLKVGMFANVSITTGFVENALSLPEEAIFEDEGRNFVFIQKDGESFEQREVKTGIRGNGYVQLISGLNKNERVVTKGGYYVRHASVSARMPEGHGHGHGDHGHAH